MLPRLFTDVTLKSEYRSVAQSRFIPNEGKAAGKASWPGIEWSQRLGELTQVCGGPGVANVQIVGHLRAAVEGGCKTTDYNEIDACIA